MKMSRTEFLMLLAIALGALGYARQAMAEEVQGELDIVKTIVISFEQKRTTEEAGAVLEKAGLDPKQYVPMSWDENVRRMIFLGEATAEQTEKVSQALAKAEAKARVDTLEYAAGDLIVGFKAETTPLQAEAILRALGYRRWDKPMDFGKHGLFINIRGLPRGKEWEASDNLRKHDSVISTELNLIDRLDSHAEMDT